MIGFSFCSGSKLLGDDLRANFFNFGACLENRCLKSYLGDWFLEH